MNGIINYILDRAKEKSTWTSLGVALTGIGVNISPDKWQAIMGFGMGLIALIGVFLPARVTQSQVKPDAQ